MKCKNCGFVNSVNVWTISAIKKLNSKTNPNLQSMYWINKEDYDAVQEYYRKRIEDLKSKLEVKRK